MRFMKEVMDKIIPHCSRRIMQIGQKSREIQRQGVKTLDEELSCTKFRQQKVIQTVNFSNTDTNTQIQEIEDADKRFEKAGDTLDDLEYKHKVNVNIIRQAEIEQATKKWYKARDDLENAWSAVRSDNIGGLFPNGFFF